MVSKSVSTVDGEGARTFLDFCLISALAHWHKMDDLPQPYSLFFQVRGSLEDLAQSRYSRVIYPRSR